MKKVLIVCAIFIALLNVPVLAIAQTVDPPDNVISLLTQLNVYMGSLAGIAAMSSFLGSIILGLFKPPKGFVRMIIIWLISITIMILSNVFNYGFAAEFSWLACILYGLGAGLAANGFSTVPVVHTILEFIESIFNKKEPVLNG
ncbi:MAG: hypothetical protein GT597_13940 [Bacteroidales bacterium]|jgi:hypothetical protein|nr:hypothetical protein [Bacteroidales bacterium]